MPCVKQTLTACSQVDRLVVSTEMMQKTTGRVVAEEEMTGLRTQGKNDFYHRCEGDELGPFPVVSPEVNICKPFSEDHDSVPALSKDMARKGVGTKHYSTLE